MVIPTFIELWSQNNEGIEFLKSLEIVAFAGGPLSPRLGDRLVAAGVMVRPAYGGTEFGAVTRVIPRKGDEKDWEWMEFSDRAHVQWISAGDGTYECQLLVNLNGVM